jgi:hypothetical protein
VTSLQRCHSRVLVMLQLACIHAIYRDAVPPSDSVAVCVPPAGKLPVMEIVFLAVKEQVVPDEAIFFSTAWGMPMSGVWCDPGVVILALHLAACAGMATCCCWLDVLDAVTCLCAGRAIAEAPVRWCYTLRLHDEQPGLCGCAAVCFSILAATVVCKFQMMLC